jgi:hypothetical protein
MKYYFIENTTPISDPNINLNFNDDILYKNIIGDNQYIDQQSERNGSVNPLPAKPKSVQKKVQPFNWVPIIFILLAIFTIMLWYVYRETDSHQQLKLNLNKSDESVNILSPDFGTGMRMGRY